MSAFQDVDRLVPPAQPVGRSEGLDGPGAATREATARGNQARDAAAVATGVASLPPVRGGWGSREGAPASEASVSVAPRPSAFEEDHAQADRTAGATIPRSPSSTGGGVPVPGPTPRPFDVNVDKDGHQVRERPVNCRLCGRAKTWNHDARCDGCKRQRCYEQGPVLDATCLLPLGHDEPHVWTHEVNP